MMKAPMSISRGKPWPLGATLCEGGVNFAVFSAHATAVTLCLFPSEGSLAADHIALQERSGDIWHVHVAGLQPGCAYGYRVEGMYAPDQGHRFNPNKLLLDPYARGITGKLAWCDALMGFQVGHAASDLSFDTTDNAPFVPRSVVVDPHFDWGDDHPPGHLMADTVIYEAHVKALTMRNPAIPPQIRGTYAALAHPSVIGHLKTLGVTALELLPVHAFFDDRFLVNKGLTNHWGYNSVGFFAPEPRYGGADPLRELQTAVKALHAADIEVILDVVYNHTGEGDEFGPTLAFRGLDNASYYYLAQGGRRYVNDAGTGNTLNLTHPAVLRMVMDSLRYWVEHVHIDGFRFDLATILGREAQGFDPQGGFFDAIRQDPVLAKVKLIAEPWDIGPGGYQLGAFPAPFSEWNDRFRDGVRQFWKGDANHAPIIARRFLGSAELFDHSRRPATASVNFITAHDGFTLEDLVTYTVKQNLANGENNRDGHDDNHAVNMGVEGVSDDPAILAQRHLRKRNLLATLMLSQGMPMLLAGDEMGHSQFGNNNAYAQDNDITWIDWSSADQGLIDFVARLSRLRAEHPVLRQTRFLHAKLRPSDGLAEVIWRKVDGQTPAQSDWHDPDFVAFGVEIRMAAEGRDAPDVLFVVFNRGTATRLRLPDTASSWRLVLDTTRPQLAPSECRFEIDLPGQSVLVFQPICAGEVS
jgi:isoamylase